MPSLAHRHLLREAANNHASTLIIVGLGDGSLIRAMITDPHLHDKNIYVLVLDGEDPNHAQAIAHDIREQTTWHLADLSSPHLIAHFVGRFFATHATAPRLAGCDFIDSHELNPTASAARQDLLPQLYRDLTDQISIYGNDLYDTFIGLNNGIRNAHTLLQAPSLDECAGHFATTPVISVAAGPSLAAHIPALRELQDKVLIVACDAVVSGLISEGITPHFVTPLERIDNTTTMAQHVEGTHAFFAGTPVVPPEALAYYNKRALFLASADRLYPWLAPDVKHIINFGSSTGVLSVTVGMALSHGPIYLVGHDLARSPDSSHWSGAKFAGDAFRDSKAQNANSVISGMEDRWITGNNGDQVLSTGWWDRFRKEISHNAYIAKANQRTIYNVNAHSKVGALINHCASAPLPDPSTLAPRSEIQLPPGRPDRYQSWLERARHLPEDIDAYREHIEQVRDQIGTMRRQELASWNITQVADAFFNPPATVSEGNHLAFRYLLRSALHNSQAEMEYRRRTASRAHFQWQALNTLEALADAIHRGLTTIGPKLVESLHVHH
ncbi:MAG: 6-hydroxymethylpterin diphosphokinase MptE-like protein [Planctomycetota bacterium]|jgi:hypothetical protein